MYKLYSCSILISVNHLGDRASVQTPIFPKILSEKWNRPFNLFPYIQFTQILNNNSWKQIASKINVYVRNSVYYVQCAYEHWITKILIICIPFDWMPSFINENNKSALRFHSIPNEKLTENISEWSTWSVDRIATELNDVPHTHATLRSPSSNRHQ